MLVKYVLVVFLIPGPNIWAPRGAVEFNDPLECIARAAEIQFSKDSPLNAVCWPVPVENPAEEGEQEELEDKEPSKFIKNSKEDILVSL